MKSNFSPKESVKTASKLILIKSVHRRNINRGGLQPVINSENLQLALAESDSKFWLKPIKTPFNHWAKAQRN